MPGTVHPLAGKPAPPELLIDPEALRSAYFDVRPDPQNPLQQVSFGTSGHRGRPDRGTFNEAHILAIVQAICEHRASRGISGPLCLGMDTHAASALAHETALEVLAANGVEVLAAADSAFTPTPVISHAILTHNRGRKAGLADGIVITPSHNPPEDGGIKYNPPHGGPADTATTRWIQDRANAILQEDCRHVRRVTARRARQAATTRFRDFATPYVRDLASVVDMEEIRRSALPIAVDPLGGAGLGLWDPVCEMYGVQVTVVNRQVDPTFRFMTVDHDGKIRMDCSSPWAMAGLVGLKERYAIAFGNDPDADRHGIVTPTGGLMNPNHYLSAATAYLFANRPQWGPATGIGKTVVTSSMIDRVGQALGRPVTEVPVGFKWFVEGLLSSSFGLAGEESAGASFLRMDGTVWTTDKDGIILGLLAAEITAKTGRDPSAHYEDLCARFGRPVYARIDLPAAPAEKQALARLSPDAVAARELAGEPILARLTRAPGNGAEIGGLKVVAESGWFAARPSGTEDICKIYAESFRGPEHLEQIVAEARQIVAAALGSAG